jgi:hypothetical protein
MSNQTSNAYVLKYNIKYALNNDEVSQSDKAVLSQA